MPYALIRDGIVVHKIDIGQAQKGFIDCHAEVQCGWLATGNGDDWAFAPPPPPPEPTAEEIAAIAQEQTRARRDLLLKESDWTQLPDAPVDQARWAVYRQALRDLDMTDPDWPQKPEGDVSEDEKLRVERVLDRAARTILFDGKNKA